MKVRRINLLQYPFHPCGVDQNGNAPGYIAGLSREDGRTVPGIWHSGENRVEPLRAFPEECQGEAHGLNSEGTIAGQLLPQGCHRQAAEPYPALFVLEPDGSFHELRPPQGMMGEGVYLTDTPQVGATVVLHQDVLGDAGGSFQFAHPSSIVGRNGPYQVPRAVRWSWENGIWEFQPFEAPPELLAELLGGVKDENPFSADFIAAECIVGMSYIAAADSAGRFLVNLMRSDGRWCPLIWNPNGDIERAFERESIDLVSMYRGLYLTDRDEVFVQDMTAHGRIEPNYLLRVAANGSAESIPCFGTFGVRPCGNELAVSPSGKYFIVKQPPDRCFADRDAAMQLGTIFGQTQAGNFRLWVRNEEGVYAPPAQFDPRLEEGLMLVRAGAISDAGHVLCQVTDGRFLGWQMNRING